MIQLRAWTTFVAATAICMLPAIAAAQQQGTLVGTVVDALGGRIAGASVTLVGEQPKAGETRSNADGVYTFQNLAPGRYQVVVTASGFEVVTSDPVFVGAGEGPIQEVRHRDLEELGQFQKTPRRDAIVAALVFLDLLEADPQNAAEGRLAEAQFQPAPPDLPADEDVDRIGCFFANRERTCCGRCPPRG